MNTVLLLVLAAWAAPTARTASYNDLARLVSPTVTCRGAQCEARVNLPITREWGGEETTFQLSFTADFEDYDNAMHFRGTSDGVKIIDTNISGTSPFKVHGDVSGQKRRNCEAPTLACHKVSEGRPNLLPALMVCVYFSDINSVGNSLQVCATVRGGVINNPPHVLAGLGCFTADTSTSSMAHSISSRAPDPDRRVDVALH